MVEMVIGVHNFIHCLDSSRLTLFFIFILLYLYTLKIYIRQIFISTFRFFIYYNDVSTLNYDYFTLNSFIHTPIALKPKSVKNYREVTVKAEE